jgi:hypothetical protein
MGTQGTETHEYNVDGKLHLATDKDRYVPVRFFDRYGLMDDEYHVRVRAFGPPDVCDVIIVKPEDMTKEDFDNAVNGLFVPPKEATQQ